MGWLDGQVALVTGGGSGIGRAVVARFVEEAARVGVMERVAARAGELRSQFGEAEIFDVWTALADFPEEKLGLAFDELFAVNVKGCLFGAKAALPELQKTAGSMIFTASVAGLNSGGGGALYTASKHAVVGLIRELAVELAPDIRVNGVAPGGTMTDLRGLTSLGNDDRSQFANPGIEERLRRGNPLGIALQPDDLAGAYVFLASRRDPRRITGSII